MHRYEKTILEILKKKQKSDPDSLINAGGLGKDETLWALESLSGKGLIEITRENEKQVSLTEEGMQYVKEGLPEMILLKRLKEGTIPIKNLGDKRSMIGLQWAKKKGFIVISNGSVLLSDKGVNALERGIDTQKDMEAIASGNTVKDIEELIKRGLAQESSKNRVSMVTITRKGIDAKLNEVDESLIDSVDRKLIATKGWEGKNFKPYDIKLEVEKPVPARRHPLSYTIGRIREAYVSNGFTEVSGPIIDSAFWVFDSLFEPQDHPARDAQDTFYIANADETEASPEAYVNRVKKAHTKGWKYRWSLPTSRETVLRTHTTSVSARYIYDIISGIMEEGKAPVLPIKLFSTGRIFRNENIDYKHLADFYQTDGIIIGEDLRLAHLFDTILKLYSWLGTEIRFKPAYFPFVEPGAELYAYSKKSSEWMELGGSGVIRREITGVRNGKISVLAWGVGVERLALIGNERLKGISELYNNGLGWLRKSGD